VLRVRPATIADLDFVVSGNLEMAIETEGLTLNEAVLREGVRAILGDTHVPGAYWIAELNGVVVAQLMITFEWSDWRNRMIWWIQSVYVSPGARRHGVFRALYLHVRDEATAAGAGGLRLYVDTTNSRAQQVYAALGMNGDHYRVFEDMF
jgi:GNAT superfamily N-acetyltransferase